MTIRLGGYLCGSVRYALRGNPYRHRLCHCADCRKESGSAFVAYAHWQIEDTEVTGSVSTYRGKKLLPDLRIEVVQYSRE
jgi:hypothetical protein